MFSDFQNMLDKIKSGVNTVKNSVNTKQQDYANTAQKYNINGRQIHQLKLLSQGAFGFIWLAQDIQTKQQFALKRVICMTQERLRESKLQKQVMSRLPKSQYIVKYHGGDVISRNGQKIVITLMELCDGGTLFDLLEKKQNVGFKQEQLIKIIFSVANGLHTIHQTGYYHRDVKIQNVLLGNDKKYKLCDFGSCTKQIYKFCQINKKDYDSIKQSIQCMTTPMYRPPQIVDPYLQYTIDQKADIWMLGCVLYTLSYFTHPFLDANAVGISTGTYRFPKYPDETKYNVSDKIKDLIRHMLTPNPTFRPSALELIELLKGWGRISQVTLNRQAARRKQQEIDKQKQLEKLNKKCVDYDGDIPIEKLMELQKRLKKTQIQEKPSSFINKKGTQKLNDQTLSNKIGINAKNNLHTNPFDMKPNNQPNTNNNNTQIPKHQHQQIKKQTNFDNLWGNNFPQSNSQSFNAHKITSQQSSNGKQNSFDFFSSFGNNTNNSLPSQQQQRKPSQNSVNFQQMFADTPNNLTNISNDFINFSINNNKTITNNQNQNKKVESENVDLI